MNVNIFDISDENGKVILPDWLHKAEVIHRQLRPQLPGDYAGKMHRIFSEGGRMAVAVKDEIVIGVAVFRIYENTALGRHMYVDDLITNTSHRSQGVGKVLLNHLQKLAKQTQCEALTLDSASHRLGAHKFYFREEFAIVAFHFAKYFQKTQ